MANEIQINFSKVFQFVYLTSLTFIFLLFFAINNSIAQSPTPSKKAFIIAIANYPRVGGWDRQNPLSSLNDLALLKAVLMKQGFDSTNITEVTEQKATKQNILNEFKIFEDKLKIGDKIVFHFSGHGQQIYDFSNDEPDRLDEALVVYDSPASAKENQIYKGEKHILDDELNEMFYRLRKKVGDSGHLVAFIDACHSGTASRSDTKSRGGLSPIIPKNKVVLNTDIDESTSGYRDLSAQLATDIGLGKLVVFGGTASNALNFELTDPVTNIGYGSLTFGVCKAFSNLKSSTSYRQFYSQIVSLVTTVLPSQTPMAEGNLDQIFFGGELTSQTEYFPIRSISSETIVLEAGAINNLHLNTKIGLYPAGTQNPAKIKPLYTFTVTSASPLLSEAKPDSTLPKDEEKHKLWAFVIENSFQNLKLKLYLKGIDKSNSDKLKSILQLPHIQWTSRQVEADLSITLDGNTQNFLINNAKTNTPFGTAIPIVKLSDRIATFIKVKILKGFDGDDDDLKTEVQINDKKNNVKCEYLPNKNRQNTVQNISVGQNVCVSSKNLSQKSVYVTIVEFWADGTLHQIYPASNTLEDPLKPNNNFSYGGEVSKSPNEPYGQHIIKIFATIGKQLDFKSLEEAQFRGNKGKTHPLEDFIFRSRGIPNDTTDDNDKIYTQTLVYNLVPSSKH
jgi:metacaspase-1